MRTGGRGEPREGRGGPGTVDGVSGPSRPPSRMFPAMSEPPPDPVHRPDHEGMPYRRRRRSGLRLQVLSPGLWHDVRGFEAIDDVLDGRAE